MTRCEAKDGPDLADLIEARRRLEGHAACTPLLESPHLNQACGARVLVKAEALQRTGSFKFRGAYNRISRLTAAQRRHGVVAFSSGNHAQGVAAAARLLDVPALVVMPASAPSIKQTATESLGAELVLFEGTRPELEAHAEQLARARRAALVRPYDDRHVIAGQGTVGLEVADQLAADGTTPDVVLVPCSGGGLIAGVALALRGSYPDAEIIAVEPAGFDDTGRSLSAGKRLANRAGGQSICDALLFPQPGALTFPLNARLLSGAIAVSDEAVARAMVASFLHLKLVTEPSGAIALAACLSGAARCRDKTVVVVASGGNVEPSLFRQVLRSHAP